MVNVASFDLTKHFKTVHMRVHMQLHNTMAA